MSIYNYLNDKKYVQTSPISFIPPPNKFITPAPSTDLVKSWTFSKESTIQKPSLELKLSQYTPISDTNESYTRLFSKMTQVCSLPYYALAREKANPWTCVRDSIFMNRAALKLANLDFLFRLISNPGAPFADLCGGPGGFMEYLFWRGAGSGVGVTLKKGVMDYQPPFHPAFKRVYGPDGEDGDCIVSKLIVSDVGGCSE
jgi:hypothetical protein